jgi:glycosyltransferase involved in cell wall biosynthesis
VTGLVDDVRPYLERASVVIAPLRIGGGTRLKIFEAMSAGRAIVSTTIGAEGLPVEHERNILLADDARTFADEVIRVLNDAELRRRLGASALSLADAHDWSSVVGVFERAIRAACADTVKAHPVVED